MPFWKLVLEYDGTDFAGWQVQPGERTVQSELDRALSTVLRQSVHVQGAGRTDAGVHALGQVASFESSAGVAEALYSVNAVLPDDVVVRSATAFEARFHARFDAVRRHYRYRLHVGPAALARRTRLVIAEADIESMRRAAERIVGDRDFASFGSELAPGEPTQCRVEKVSVREKGRCVDVEVTANRFLRKMIRTFVGTLLEIGWGKHPPEWMDEVLAARDRRAAGPVVAPQGLFLMGVDYPETFSGNGGHV